MIEDPHPEAVGKKRRCRDRQIGVVVFLVMLVILQIDFSQLGSLIATSGHGWRAAVVLTVVLGSTFAKVQIGIALTLQAEPPQDY